MLCYIPITLSDMTKMPFLLSFCAFMSVKDRYFIIPAMSEQSDGNVKFPVSIAI